MRRLMIAFFVFNVILLDGSMLYILNLSRNLKTKVTVSESKPSQVTEKASEGCGADCQKYIDEKLASANVKISVTPAVTAKPTAASISRPKVRNTSYLPVPGSGSVDNTSWTTLTGTDFYLSKNDYPGFKGAYFEANMKLVNGNGYAYLRIFDLTHSVAVNGSEISSSSQTSTFVSSGAISLWEGNNHYVIQGRSLTADTTVFETGRVKILTEN